MRQNDTRNGSAKGRQGENAGEEPPKKTGEGESAQRKEKRNGNARGRECRRIPMRENAGKMTMRENADLLALRSSVLSYCRPLAFLPQNGHVALEWTCAKTGGRGCHTQCGRDGPCRR